MVVNKLYNIPRPEDILEEAKRLKEKDRWLSQKKLLALKSRSFAIPIAQLHYCRGRMEAEKEEEIQNLYISLRELDTIEDGRLNKDKKIEAIDALTHIYTEVNRPETDLENLIKNDLKNLTAEILPGAIDEEERVFIEQFGYGDPLRFLREFKPAGLREKIIGCIGKMASGMKSFLKKEKLETMSDFSKYCYYVAESVGEALNGIVHIKDNIKSLDYELARDTGSFLQSTNIIKNLREDFTERGNRVVFIPQELYKDANYDDLFLGDVEKVKELRSGILKTLIGYATSYFKNAVQYAIKIPADYPGYTAFVTTSIISAKETLETIKMAGAEKVFLGDKTATKIKSGTFGNIATFTDEVSGLDNGIRIRDWLVKFQHDPSQFLFREGEYETWAPKYLTREYYSANGNR